MVRVFSVLAVVALAVGGCARDSKPYVWPTPVYGVPFTQTSFQVRYSDWRNTPDEIREVIAKYCGPRFDVARVYVNQDVGPLLHPNSLTVQCGSSPDPLPRFRGQDLGLNYMISLDPSSPSSPIAPARQ